MLPRGVIFTVFLFAHGIQGLSYYIQDIYIEEMDPEYFDPETSSIEVVWVNSTKSGIALNITMLKSMPRGTTGNFNLFLKTMGEYKTNSGIAMSVPWCEVLSDPVLLGNLAQALGMKESECPPPPGLFTTDYWEPSTAKLPDYFPGTDYKAIFSLAIKKKILLLVHTFVSLY